MAVWTDLTFGAELEMYVPANVSYSAILTAIESAGVPVTRGVAGVHQTVSGWKAVHDGSLRNAPSGFTGVEVVSPILSGEAGIAQVITVARIVKALGAVVNMSCGLHVHIGAGNASVGQMKNLAKMFVKYEHHFDAVCPPSRHNNQYAKSNRVQAGGVERAFAQLEGVRTVRRVAEVMNGGFHTQHYHPARYFKLNFQSLNSHGTVEYRQQAGSVEGEKIAAWIKTVAQFTAQAFTLRTVGSQSEPTFAKFCKKLDRDTAVYMTQRRARLARGQAPAA